MCGRYVLSLRPSEVRQQLEQSQMPVDTAPNDDSVRQSYNFAPGYYGLVYRAGAPRHAPAGTEPAEHQEQEPRHRQEVIEGTVPLSGYADATQYRLQAMKWGLVPFWTKRNPDYSSMLKTINCRDDSLYDDRGMWTSMKKKKRCIIIAQGFYEWLKKNNGKEKLPHFTRRKDSQLMCFAGLWDCVQYEDSTEPLYTYSIITTGSNKQLSFLHDRMPVILENGSDDIRTWLDPNRTEWNEDLQSLLRPYPGQLECYPVSKDVGKVGNNSPSFLVPLDSVANKNNIANFFSNQRRLVEAKASEQGNGCSHSLYSPLKMESNVSEPRTTTDDVEGSEDNAPLPVPASSEGAQGEGPRKAKRQAGELDGDMAAGTSPRKRRVTAGPNVLPSPSPKKGTAQPSAKKSRSATSNGNAATSRAQGDGSRKITSFFGK